ncbi:MAG: hypothetical protein AMXMBFR66_03160 [Pseudomonadota bacterium]|jgi:multicomponent Na+:H+ antiporter subunit E
MHASSNLSADRAEAASPAARPLRPSRLIARLVALTLLWWAVTGGTVSSWIVGVPAIVAAALLAPRAMDGPWRLSLPGALRFAAFFLRESLRGGVDVAQRVSTPRPRVAPGLVLYRWRLPEGSPARALFALCASLLPGTLVANLGGQALLIHALDTGAPVAAELAALEDAVAAMFSLELTNPEAAHG